MITTPDKLRLDAARLDAYLEAFEHTYLHFLEAGSSEKEQRIRGSFAFFEIREKVEYLMAEMEELAGHMEVCDAVFAVARTKGGCAV